MLGASGTKPEERAPMVIPMDSVRLAVHEVLDPLLNEDQAAPTAPQMDLFTSRIEDAGPAPGDVGEVTLQRLAAIRARDAARAAGEIPDGYHDANLPGSTGWTSPPAA